MDVSAQLLLDEGGINLQSKSTSVPKNSTNNNDDKFSNYLDKSKTQVNEKNNGEQPEAQQVKVKSKSNLNKTVSEQSEKSQNKTNSDKIDNDNQAAAKETNSDDDQSPVVDESASRTENKEFANLMLQRAINKNTLDLDSLNKIAGLGANMKQDSESNKHASIAELLRLNELNARQNLQLLGKGSDTGLDSLSPDMLKLLAGDNKQAMMGFNNNSRLTDLLNGKLQAENLKNLNDDKLAEFLESLSNEDLDISEDVSDLLTKLTERLDVDKTKSDIILQSRMNVDKSLTASDMLDQLNMKNTPDSIDKTSMLSGLNATQRSNTSSVQQFTLNTHVNQPEWGAELGKRLQFMIKSNIQQADIRLDPPELGRINIRINMAQDQTNISFTALNANVREAIEQTLPKLRELLGESGLQLGNTDVASQFKQQGEQATQQGKNPFTPVLDGFDSEEEMSDSLSLSNSTVYESDGVIDYFA